VCVWGTKAEDAEEAIEKWVEKQHGWMGRGTKEWKEERRRDLNRVQHCAQ